jgi:hypothetical protein
MTQATVTNTDYIQVGQNQGIIKIYTEGDREKSPITPKKAKPTTTKTPKKK